MEKCRCGCKKRCRCPWRHYLVLIKSRKRLSLAKMTEKYRHELRAVSYEHPLLAFDARCCPVRSIGEYLSRSMQSQTDAKKNDHAKHAREQ